MPTPGIQAVRLRDSLPHEGAAIARLTVEAFEDYAGILSGERWEAMRSVLNGVAAWARTGRWIVAEQAGSLVGSVGYFPPGQPDDKIFPPDWASIRFLAVAPAHRGKGLGRLLTEECILRARQDRAARIGLHTSEVMTVARLMYERLGFRQECEIPRRYGLRYWRYVLELGADERSQPESF